MTTTAARAEVGWKIYPFSPSFWNRPAVRELDPRLAYLGPLPQSNRFLDEITAANMMPAYVYTVQDIEGDVLYVGKTINLIGRLSNHRTKRPWWPHVGLLTLLGVEAEDRRQADSRAFQLETEAIQDLRPHHNIAGVTW